jgi:AcrR family transcriptional regulator
VEQERAEIIPSLRERKKAKTRAALIEASQRLFARRGYTGTTLEDISAEVDITTQTLLRYFDSKAQLALAPLAGHLEEIERFLEDEHRTLDALSAWRRYLQREAEGATNPSESTTATWVANLRAYDAWVDKDPLLVASLNGVEQELQEILTRALARDAGVASDDLHSTLVAALLVAGRKVIWDRWLARICDNDSLVGDQLAVVDYAVGNRRFRDK